MREVRAIKPVGSQADRVRAARGATDPGLPGAAARVGTRLSKVPMSPWVRSFRADPHARVIADRHYNRQSVGAAQFVPPGRCLVLLTARADALWVTSWPFAEYVQHEWAGAWMNSCFRNEGEQLSSDLIRAAVAATLAEWPTPPDLGMVTFVDRSKVRRKRDPGRCYIKAGFRLVGTTKAGLLAFQMLPDEMPDPLPCLERQERLWGAA